MLTQTPETINQLPDGIAITPSQQIEMFTFIRSSERDYPTRCGIPVPAWELDLPIIDFTNKQNRLSKHHDCWTRRRFGRSILFSTLRDLETCQTNISRGTHDLLHKIYLPPQLPTPQQAMNYVSDACENGTRLCYGTAMNPEYEKIGKELLHRVKADYKKLK